MQISRVLTRLYYIVIYSHVRKNAPPLGSHAFQAKVTISELIQDISVTNLLSKFHEDRTKNVASIEKCPTLGSHVFQANVTIFKLIQDANVDVEPRTTDNGRQTKGDHKSSP
ncbi:hypothetical protein DPMN_129577 [Dreissena polymorpha]|uniref:Uncharacterized protein n=1 Tax=Dreissena polymorpha TaxID=45954 RepID=A0A9D4H3F5_DREPO|nr:hypothetical protein DPMN_129577 [Dreissena polymorpha]